MIGVNCLFNKVIPTYSEEYFAELNKMKFETVEDASSVSNLEYLIGVRYVDDAQGVNCRLPSPCATRWKERR